MIIDWRFENIKGVYAIDVSPKYIRSSSRTVASVEKRILISPVDEDILVRSDSFYFFISFLYSWRRECHETKAMLSGVSLEC